LVFIDQEISIMVTESFLLFLLAAPAIGLGITIMAVIALGYLLASCTVARLQGKTCSQ